MEEQGVGHLSLSLAEILRSKGQTKGENVSMLNWFGPTHVRSIAQLPQQGMRPFRYFPVF